MRNRLPAFPAILLLAVAARLALVWTLNDGLANFPSRMRFVGYTLTGQNPFVAILAALPDEWGIAKWPYLPLAIVPYLVAAMTLHAGAPRVLVPLVCRWGPFATMGAMVPMLEALHVNVWNTLGRLPIGVLTVSAMQLIVAFGLAGLYT